MLSGECNYREKQFFHKRHIKVINWGKGSGNVKGGWGQWTLDSSATTCWRSGQSGKRNIEKLIFTQDDVKKLVSSFSVTEPRDIKR